MNRVVLVGNGFDLAHGLPTKYVDFIDWYWEECVKSLKMCRQYTWSDLLCTFTLKTKETWLSFFYTNVGTFNVPKGSELIRRFRDQPEIFEIKLSPFFERIATSIEEKGWVDIENEYYTLLQSLRKDDVCNSPKRLNDELDYLKGNLAEYLNTVQSGINFNILPINELKDLMLAPFHPCEIAVSAKSIFDNFVKTRLDYTEQDWADLWVSWNKTWDSITRAFMSDLKKKYERSIADEGIESVLCHQIPEYFLLPDRMLLLNFNYTKIADTYLDWDREKLHQTIHIHGELPYPKGMIFGYGDELDDDYKRILRLNDNEYLRNIKSVRYLETANYRQMLLFIESAPYQIYIMGHSCGNSDRTLLNTLFEHRNCVSIKPFYYRTSNGADNYMNLSFASE